MRALGRADDEGRLRHLDDRLALEPRKPRGNGLRRRAELPCREAGLVELDPVRQADGHEIAFPDAEFFIGAGEPVGARLEFRARHHAALMRDGGRIRVARRPEGGNASDRHGRHVSLPCVFMIGRRPVVAGTDI
jgi:hypothetical protein